MERRLEWPMLVAALLVIPAIAIEQSEVGQPWDTIATVLAREAEAQRSELHERLEEIIRRLDAIERRG